MADTGHPPVSMQGAISLIWALAEDTPPRGGATRIADHYLNWLPQHFNEQRRGEIKQADIRFLEEMSMLAATALRNLRYYVDVYVESSKEIDRQLAFNIEYLNDLATLTSLNVRSLLPRVLSAGLGGASGFSVASFLLPTTGVVAVVVLASLVAATGAEFLLRWWRSRRINEILVDAVERKGLLRIEALRRNGNAELRAFADQFNALIVKTYGKRCDTPRDERNAMVTQTLPHEPAEVSQRMTLRRVEVELAIVKEARQLEKKARRTKAPDKTLRAIAKISGADEQQDVQPPVTEA